MTVPVVNNPSVRANDALHFTTRPLVLLLLLRILLLLLHLNLSLPPLLKQQSPNSTLRFEKARGAHLFLEGGILRWLTLCVALSPDDDITFIVDVIDDALAREIIRSKDTIFLMCEGVFFYFPQKEILVTSNSQNSFEIASHLTTHPFISSLIIHEWEKKTRRLIRREWIRRSSHRERVCEKRHGWTHRNIAFRRTASQRGR